jgi:coproporphyrinogen III oxidase-like Fe-S oxidoreductase
MAPTARPLGKPDAFTTARYGVTLDRQEQMRRLIALQILSAAGLDLFDFANRFGCSPFDVADELNELVELGLMERVG